MTTPDLLPFLGVLLILSSLISVAAILRTARNQAAGATVPMPADVQPIRRTNSPHTRYVVDMRARRRIEPARRPLLSARHAEPLVGNPAMLSDCHVNRPRN